MIADIKYYKEKYGCSNFVFKDSTFTAKKKWAAEFCQALIDSGVDIKWRCNTRVNLVPPPLLELMAKAGCYVINFGVESGHPDILKKIKKEVDLEEVRDAHERCRKLGIRTYATFLMGNPGETDETAQATINLATTIRPSLAMFFVSTAYPGTPMYDEAVLDGSVEPRWWAKQEWGSDQEFRLPGALGLDRRRRSEVHRLRGRGVAAQGDPGVLLPPAVHLGHPDLHRQEPVLHPPPVEPRHRDGAVLQAAQLAPRRQQALEGAGAAEGSGEVSLRADGRVTASARRSAAARRERHPSASGRHVRLMRGARQQGSPADAPFLILFINSICNLACDHCFYWKELNQRRRT